MEKTPKSVQELATQMQGVYPYFSSYTMPQAEADRLDAEARNIKKQADELEPYLIADDELGGTLDSLHAQAVASGVWSPDHGQGSDERIAHAIEHESQWGFDEEQTVFNALGNLKKSGYLNAIRSERRDREATFKNPIRDFINDRVLSDEEQEKQLEKLRQRTYDLTDLAAEDLERINQDFTSGNFMYHGSGTEQLITILSSGALMNFKALYEREEQQAQEEGREKHIIRRNSGYEGISWSMNAIDGLPGDRFHIAGFVAAPEKVLKGSDQLAVPSRPAPNEVLQLSSGINANKFYEAKTQFELYRQPGIFGEANSAYDNLLAVRIWEDKDARSTREEPMLYQAARTLLKEPGYQEKLRSMYDVEKDGTILLNPDLLQQVANEIPVAAVWLQAAAESGRLADTEFANLDLESIIASLTSENITTLLSIMRNDWQTSEQIIDNAEEIQGSVEVPTEDMYFVAPKKDAELWLNVLARCEHQPAGILLYDDKKVRLENFAGKHRGDHEELTAELRGAIIPKNNFIEYSEVLGSEFTDDMRAGHKHHVIAEKHLGNRRSIKSVDGKLVLG